MAELPTTAELLTQGLFHHRQGQLSLAMDRYTDVLRNDPVHPESTLRGSFKELGITALLEADRSSECV